SFRFSLTTPSSFVDRVSSFPSEEGLHPSSFHLSMLNQFSGAGPSTPSSAVPMQSPAFANQFGHMSPSFNQQRMMMASAPSSSTSMPSIPPAGMYNPMMGGFPSGMVPTPMMMQPSSIPAAVAPAPSKKAAAAAAAAAAQQHQQQMMNAQQMHHMRQQPLHPTVAPVGQPAVTLHNGQPLFVFINGLVTPHHPVYSNFLAHFHQHQHQQRMMMQRQQQMAAAAAAAAA
ncbi:hypothetical protein PMAYCL1PPCAC_17595, partial [Pristionchus mayeri]